MLDPAHRSYGTYEYLHLHALQPWAYCQPRLPVNNGGDISYRMSKFALLSETVTLAQDLQEEGEKIVAVFIIPAMLLRDRVLCSENDMIECMDDVVEVIERLKMEDPGKFLNWTNETVPF